MAQSCGARARPARAGERGGARLNFLIVLVLLAAVGYAGYQAVPVFYRASLLETYMQDTVNTAAMLTKSPAWVEQQIRANAADYGLPPDTRIEAATRDGRVEAHVQFTRTIPLIVTTYQYTFDHTARSAAIVGGG